MKKAHRRQDKISLTKAREYFGCDENRPTRQAIWIWRTKGRKNRSTGKTVKLKFWHDGLSPYTTVEAIRRFQDKMGEE